MDYREIRNFIVSGLYNYLEIPVVPTDDIGDKPDYPYVSYKFITLYIPQGPYNLLKDTVPSLDENFEYDVEYTKEEQPKMIISINSYSDDEVESYNLGLKVREWFNFYGYHYLKEKGVIVSNIGNLQDRTVLIVDNYEKRQGFDVTIRVVDIHKTRIETIEEINMSRR